MNVDAVAAELALSNHGLVSRRLLRHAGVPSNTIDSWLQRSRAVVVVPGVYRIFDADTELQAIAAATLSLRRSAADLQTAARLHGFSVHSNGLPLLVVPHGFTHRSGLARVRQTHHLPDLDTCVVNDVRSLTLARTVCELVPVLSRPAADRLVTRALSSPLLTESELLACDVSMARRGRPGVQLRRERLAPLLIGVDSDMTVLEREFALRYRRLDMPPLEAQYEPPWFEGVHGVVDFAAVDHQVIIEVDGRRWHDSVDARINDARRDRRAARHGWRVIRFGWDEVVHRWDEVVEHLAVVLRPDDPPMTA